MQVHIYQKPSGGALAFLAAFTANQSRPDVGAVYPGRTNSGWSFDPRLYPVLMDGATHDIYAYAINIDSSGAGQIPNPLFGNTPKGLTCTDPPTGTMTAACGSVSGTVNDAQGSPVTISIREQTGNIPSCLADPLRAGPLPVGPVFGPIGIPAYTDGKKHTLIACARDVPSGQQPLQPFATAQVSCPPTVALTPGSSQVDFGTSTTLAWNVANVFNADGCTATPAGWFNPASITGGSGSGTATVGPLTADTTYSLTCTNEAGVAVNDSKTITVKVPPPEASVLDVRVPADGYCAGEPAMDIEWGYSSAARKISGYQVQVLRGGSVIYDSGKVARTARAAPEQSHVSLWSRTTLLLATAVNSLFNR